ncbi:peptidoglycan editing factor PgeF [Thalassotalea sp. HSM 43]|uniref:peptidoglycan editing factor PgeF n=1 Tax=Thalassotalea sp. HSM 43 TaxID=2552945 RepID=UPI001E51B88A|nr:peptidoglycan editing factor PgeF [Thalassotalea sp. HSM 43]
MAAINLDWQGKSLSYAFTTQRDGGCSTAPFASLNLAYHVGDDANCVAENRQTIAPLLPGKQIQWLNQVHAADVARVDTVSIEPLTADAAFTNKADIALAIMTADCLPILLINKQGTEIAAIHGGWRPLSANIIANTLACFSCDNDEIYAWLGPCIGPRCFEVGAEVLSIFATQSADFTACFSATSDNKYLADLHAIAEQQLNRLGVSQISRNSDCTYTLADKYFSYRRDQQTGRMASFIAMR